MRYPPEILPMWVADMDYPVAPAITAALHERVDHGVFGYTLPTPELLETCCTYFARRWNWQVDPEWLVVSPGLGVSIHTVARYLGDLQLGLLTPEPIYHVFRDAPSHTKRQRIDIAFTRAGDDWELDPDTIVAKAKAAGGASILMLCNPHNPNGKVFTHSELETLAQLALEHDWIICSDEVHADSILDDDLQHLPIAALDPEVAQRCVTMQSPSKSFNIAGLNFAVLVIENKTLREAYCAGAKGQVVSQLNPFGMAAGKVAWDGSCDDWLQESNAHLRANRDLLSAGIAEIDGITMLPLPATVLAWLDVSALGVPNPAQHFENHGLGMSPGAVFGWPNYMRLNFGCDRATLELGLERLATAAQAAT